MADFGHSSWCVLNHKWPHLAGSHVLRAGREYSSLFWAFCHKAYLHFLNWHKDIKSLILLWNQYDIFYEKKTLSDKPFFPSFWNKKTIYVNNTNYNKIPFQNHSKYCLPNQNFMFVLTQSTRINKRWLQHEMWFVLTWKYNLYCEYVRLIYCMYITCTE